MVSPRQDLARLATSGPPARVVGPRLELERLATAGSPAQVVSPCLELERLATAAQGGFEEVLSPIDSVKSISFKHN